MARLRWSHLLFVLLVLVEVGPIAASAGAATAVWRQFPLTPSSSPNAIALGRDGAEWFTEEGTNKIGRITPTGALTEYLVPTANAGLTGIAAGPDGNIWFTETRGSKVARLVPATGQITEFAAVAGVGGIVAGSDGNLWVMVSKAGKVLVVSTAGVVLHTYNVPTASGYPHGPTLGPDGNVYFAEVNGNKVARITPTGQITEWMMPQATSKPMVTAFGADGRLYFTENLANKIGRLDTSTGAIMQWPLPTAGAAPLGITAGSDGNLWFTESKANAVGRITTGGLITEYPVPIAAAGPNKISAGSDGNLWITESSVGAIGSIAPPAGAPPANTVAPTLSGSAVVGQVLTVAPGGWTGSPAPTLSYQWQRCDTNGANCVSINGQTNTTYTVTNADVGSTLVAVVTGTNTHGQASAATAASAVVPGPASAPTNTAAPTLSGSAVVGQTLTVAPGTWTGSPAPTFSYQWQRCDTNGANCVPINGATATTYTVANADIGSTLVAVVTATNASGQASAPTAASAVVPSSLAPTTPVLDNFNRANGGAGPNWSNIRPTTGFAAMNISNNAAVDSSTTAFAWNYWNPTSYGPNVEAYVTVRTYGAADTIRVGARVTGGTTTYSGYYVSINSSGAWTIIRIDNGGSPITLASGATQTISNGDGIAIRIIGTVITALHYTTATGWTQVLSYDTATDATRYTNPGSLALEFRSSTLDDFGGGTLP